MKNKSVVFSLLICTAFFACKINTSGISLITGDFTPPKLIALEVVNERELKIGFTKSVTPASVTICRIGEDAVPVQQEAGQDNTVLVNLLQASEVGETYVLQGTVIDMNGNMLSFLTEFIGFNGRIPKLVLSEVRTELSKLQTEFVELYAQSAGNLAGVSIYSSHTGETSWYEFPAAEIVAGDYIVVHMRSIEDGIADETAAADVSGGTEAFAYARDFWMSGNTKHFSKNSVILLQERKNGKLMDALLLSELKNTAWTKTVHAEAAKRAFEGGIWSGGSEPAHAVISDGTTATRTFSRQGNLKTAGIASKSDWIIVATSNATVGKVNSDKPYIPK